MDREGVFLQRVGRFLNLVHVEPERLGDLLDAAYELAQLRLCFRVFAFHVGGVKIEELVLEGGGYGLFDGCAAGDTAAAIVLRVDVD